MSKVPAVHPKLRETRFTLEELKELKWLADTRLESYKAMDRGVIKSTNQKRLENIAEKLEVLLIIEERFKP